MVEKSSEYKGACGSYHVLAGQDYPVGYGAMAIAVPFAQRQRRRTVEKSASKGSEDTLCGDQMPDVGAEGG